MPEYDASRQADIAHLQRKLLDPKVPDSEKKRIHDTLRSIREQSGFQSIRKLRESMYQAAQRGDRAAAERIANQAKKIDRDWQL